MELGPRTLLMAVLNLTPDSFYSASRRLDLVAAEDAAAAALDAGADLLDLGAESTRPGAMPLSPREEQARLLPVIARLRARFPTVLLSADTRHADTARAALSAGADIINDVTGLAGDDMLHVAANSNCGLVLMHLRGSFATMHRLPPLADPVAEVSRGFEAILARARRAGIAEARIALDPGFGFGKNLDENFPLLAQFDSWHALNRPLLAGVSRKSFIGHAIRSGSAEAAEDADCASRACAAVAQTASGGVHAAADDRAALPPPEDRLYGTLAAVTAAILNGAHIVRVHDIAASRDAARVADAVLAAANRSMPAC